MVILIIVEINFEEIRKYSIIYFLFIREREKKELIWLLIV